MNTRTGGWIGYDWFKLIVAIILLLLLLTLWLNRGASPPGASTAPTSAPATAGVASPALSAPTLTLPAGSALATGKLTFSGTAVPGSTVQVTIDGQPAGTATVGVDGNWTLNATIDTPGDHAIVAQALDSAGAVAAASIPATLTLNAPAAAATAAPAATAIAISAPAIDLPGQAPPAGPLTMTGTGAPGSAVELMVDGQPAGTTTVGADGTWSVPIALPAGEHEIAARALDTAGNELAASSPVKLMIGAAAAPTAEAAAAPTDAAAVPTDAAAAPTAAAVPTDAAAAPTAATAPTDVATPAAGTAPAIGFPADGATLPAGSFTMTGTGTPGSTIEILDSDKVIGTVTVGADGTWSFPVTPAGGTAAYSARPAGTTDVTAKPIRVTFGAGQAADCTSLAVGCDAWVTRKGGLSLRMRAGAGTDQAIVARLPVGTQLTLLEGPQPGSGLSWWRVRTVGGREGWVAGSELVLKPD